MRTSLLAFAFAQSAQEIPSRLSPLRVRGSCYCGAAARGRETNIEFGSYTRPFRNTPLVVRGQQHPPTLRNANDEGIPERFAKAHARRLVLIAALRHSELACDEPSSPDCATVNLLATKLERERHQLLTAVCVANRPSFQERLSRFALHPSMGRNVEIPRL